MSENKVVDAFVHLALQATAVAQKFHLGSAIAGELAYLGPDFCKTLNNWLQRFQRGATDVDLTAILLYEATEALTEALSEEPEMPQLAA